MRQILFYFGILVLAAAFGSCSDSSPAERLKSQGGYPYNFVNDKEGTVIQPGQYAYFHYTRRVDDSILDGSYAMGQKPKVKLPTMEELESQPNPMMEGLSLMSAGDSLRISVDLDSIPNVPPDLKAYQYLNIDLVLESIKSEEEYQADMVEEQAEMLKKAEETKKRLPEVEALASQTINDYKSGSTLEGKIKTTASGLKYMIHEEGKGAKIQDKERLNVMYYGSLTSDGSRFDDSFSKGAPFPLTLGVGMVIPGWDEGLALLNHGDKASFFIPAQLGYGERGSPPNIPPNSELHFYVEVE